jgi:methanogenic corrinoid protein MtbC1
MRGHVASGVAPAEAARLALAAGDVLALRGPVPSLGQAHEALRGHLDAYDEAGAHAVLDRVVSAVSLTALIDGLVLPYLREVGERWEGGELSVAQEHFASGVLRARLLGLARGWGEGAGPRALLGCAPGEQHDIGLVCFGLALRAQRWQITYLGRTPRWPR